MGRVADVGHCWRWLTVLVVALVLPVYGQQAPSDIGGPLSESAELDPEPPPPEASAAVPSEAAASADPTGADESASRPDVQPINILRLLVQGGWFMIPILVVSLMVVTVGIERLFGLRTARVLPSGFVADLGKLGSSSAGFDPRQAYRICQQHPSAAANVVRAMLLKVGRPHSEVEHTVAEVSEREANRLYANVRWINLGTTVAPLLGLLGTVWGMIVCFHDTTQLDPGQNKAEFLANGIYIALVTTLAGLCVAIPAAIMAHYFEGRIQSAFHQIDELVFNLLPQIERFEGRVRFSRQSGATDVSVREVAIPEPPVQEKSPAGR